MCKACHFFHIICKLIFKMRKESKAFELSLLIIMYVLLVLILNIYQNQCKIEEKVKSFFKIHSAFGKFWIIGFIVNKWFMRKR